MHRQNRFYIAIVHRLLSLREERFCLACTEAKSGYCNVRLCDQKQVRFEGRTFSCRRTSFQNLHVFNAEKLIQRQIWSST
jgi:hypothetical protein